ncbi:MAG: glycosyltransferase [Candidatus Coatesbacteria bacterium]|nr:glycosyltransferase [Candidatus Coatesbacteria bacterium]
MLFSIIIPAHNEDEYIGKCLESIRKASVDFPEEVEVIVSINRCSDRTEEIARSYGSLIVHENSKNIARVRNAAAKAASGKIIVTIDADSWMSDNMLKEIKNLLETGRYIGGGVRIMPDRYSLGIICSLIFFFIPLLLLKGVTGGLFWCYRRDFEAIEGFNEEFLTAEDLDFARRLKKLGKKSGRKYKTINSSYIVTSTRKFEMFGHWFIFRNPRTVIKLLKGNDRELADLGYYEARNNQSKSASLTNGG